MPHGAPAPMRCRVKKKHHRYRRFEKIEEKADIEEKTKNLADRAQQIGNQYLLPPSHISSERNPELELTEENFEKIRNGTHKIKFNTIKENGVVYVEVTGTREMMGSKRMYVYLGKSNGNTKS